MIWIDEQKAVLNSLTQSMKTRKKKRKKAFFRKAVTKKALYHTAKRA